MFGTLLTVNLVPKPIPSTVAMDVLKLCLAGVNEKRDLIKLLSVRSLGVSKLLKSELLDLQTRTAKIQILPKALISHNFALDVLINLSVQDIRPICKLLWNIGEEDRWRTLASLAGCLEKSTQGKLLTGLEAQDISAFSPILKQGLSEFETDGT